MELVWKYGRLSSISFLKSSIPFHSGIFHIPYRNFRFIPFHFPFHSIPCSGFNTIIEGQEFSTVIPAVTLKKSQPVKLHLVFYLLAERLSMFSAKLNAFESILLVCIFLRYQYVATVAFTSKGFAPNHRL